MKKLSYAIARTVIIGTFLIGFFGLVATTVAFGAILGLLYGMMAPP